MTEISDAEFSQFQRFIYDAAGISLSAGKKILVASRLAKRLDHCRVESYGEYMRLLDRPDRADELQTAVDLLTTNETFFFREPKHFDYLRKHVPAMTGARTRPLRVWSAAGSTGEEAYSIAMLLDDVLPQSPWEIVASDISTRVLERARHGHYSTARTDNIPPQYLKRFCLRGHGKQEGTLLIKKSLRERVRFLHVNLNAPLPKLGIFDIVLLRNVLIYFDKDTKRRVVERVLGTLEPGGLLLIGHAETLADISGAVDQLAPAVFSKRG